MALPSAPALDGQDTPSHTIAGPHPASSGRRNLVGATIGLIAGLSAIAITETGRNQRPGIEAAISGGSAVDVQRSLNESGVSQERVQTITHYLTPERSLISVRTDNWYEIETILEIYRAGGALYTHMVDGSGAVDRRPDQSAPAMAHDHTTVLKDRMRESA
jgi:hypothetical protein